jgi:plasmid stabilization system protein ParE
MTYELDIRSEAEEDLAEAFAWYEAQVSGLGLDFLLSVDAVFNSILRSPFLYPIVYRTVRRALTRRFPYQILYVVEEKRAVVLAVFHAKRNPRRFHERA